MTAGTMRHEPWTGPQLISPTKLARPIVATIPHGGRYIPVAFSHTLAVDADTLWADWYTDELYDFLPAVGVACVRTDLSRFVADVNRDPASGHGGFWQTVVPATDPMGAVVHTRRLTVEEVALRVATAHAPFHALLDQALDGLRAVHDRVLLLDLHSFGVPLEVDIVVGDRDGTSATPDAVARIEDAFRDAGYSVARNLRFRGGWIVQRFEEHAAVDAISIEINQRCYLDAREVDSWPDVPQPDTARLQAARQRLRGVFSHAAAPR